MTPPTLPNFVVAGGARCGTTGLVEGLRSHPGVFVTSPKEPHYFALHKQGAHFTGPGDDATINRVAVTDRDDYLALYPQHHDYVALGEGSVSTLYYAAEALPEIVATNPDMRVVILLREPVERAHSSFQYLSARGFEPETDFLRAVDDEPRRRAANWHHLWHYMQMSMYAESVAAVQAAIPKENIGIWFYDDLNRDYVETVGQVLRFLGAPPAPGEAVGVPRVNISGRPRFAAVQGALRWVTSHEVLRSAVKRGTSYRFRERIRRTTLRRGGVSDEARRILAPRFADDLARLSELVPGEVPTWLRAGQAETD